MILSKLNKYIYYLCGIIVSFLMISIVVLVFSQVLSRYVFDFSLRWTTELTSFSMVWLVFLGASMGYKADKIVALTLVTGRLPVKVQELMNIVMTMILIFFFATTFYANLSLIEVSSNQSSSILGIDMRLVQSAWSVVAIILTLYAIEKIFISIRKFINKSDVEKA